MAVASVAGGLAVGLAVREPAVPVVAVVVFGGLFCLAENYEIRISPTASVSAGSLPAMAGILVCVAEGSLLGALLVGAIGGLHLQTLRAREWANQAFAVAVFALAALAAAVSVQGFESVARSSVGGLVVVGAVAAAVFALVNLALVVVGVTMDYGSPPREVVAEVLPSVWHILPFGLLGAFLGRLYLDFGAAVVVLFVVPIFIARQAFASYVTLKEQQDATVRTLIGALEAKDRYTAGHAERVARYAQYVGQDMHFAPGRLERLRFAALMHDVGKLVVPNHLLNKPGRLSEDEFAIVKQHEAVSVEILTRIAFLAPVAPSASGAAMEYRSDAGNAPIEPFIVAVADAYDAMTSSRSYRRALRQEEAFSELRNGAGRQFHPDVVEALIAAIERRGEKHGDGYEHDSVHADAPVTGAGSAGLGDLEHPPARREAEQ